MLQNSPTNDTFPYSRSLMASTPLSVFNIFIEQKVCVAFFSNLTDGLNILTLFNPVIIIIIPIVIQIRELTFFTNKEITNLFNAKKYEQTRVPKNQTAKIGSGLRERIGQAHCSRLLLTRRREQDVLCSL